MAFHSGIGTYIRNLLPYLKGSKYAIQLLGPVSFLEKWPELSGVDLIPFDAPIYSLQEQLKYPLKIPSSDLFWSPHYTIPLSFIRARKRLTTIHDVCHLAQSDQLNWVKKGYAKMMLRQATERSDHIMTISHFSKSEIVKWTNVEKEKITVAHLGVNASQFSFNQDQEMIEEVQRQYQLSSPYILYVGNLASHKNIARLLKAWMRVQAQHKDHKLVLVGKPDTRGVYKKMIVENPLLKESVITLEVIPQQHLSIVYRLAQGFVFPSLYEGFGLPPLEAMRMGCPTIVSQAASLPEVCLDASLYVDPHNIEDIAQKIMVLIRDKEVRQSLVARGKEHVKRFSWEKAAQAHLEVIERLIG